MSVKFNRTFILTGCREALWSFCAFVMMIVSQMKRLNDHEMTFRVYLEPGEEFQSFLSSHRQKRAQVLCAQVCLQCVCVVNKTARVCGK